MLLQFIVILLLEEAPSHSMSNQWVAQMPMPENPITA